jgi:hypothetical protein
MRANRFGSVATIPSRTADGAYLVSLPRLGNPSAARLAERLPPAERLTVGLGFGRIVGLYYGSSTLYQIHSENRYLCF